MKPVTYYPNIARVGDRFIAVLDAQYVNGSVRMGVAHEPSVGDLLPTYLTTEEARAAAVRLARARRISDRFGVD